jgi:hypothetical protein
MNALEMASLMRQLGPNLKQQQYSPNSGTLRGSLRSASLSNISAAESEEKV